MTQIMKCYYVQSCSGEAYRRFVEIMLRESTAFSVVSFMTQKNARLPKVIKEFKEAISALKIYSADTNHWPGMISFDQRSCYRLFAFRSDPRALDQLRMVNSLYEWDYPDHPLDLCFYKNGYVLFASCAHEMWNKLYTQDEGLIKELSDAGMVITREKDIPDEELYYDKKLAKV